MGETTRGHIGSGSSTIPVCVNVNSMRRHTFLHCLMIIVHVVMRFVTVPEVVTCKTGNLPTCQRCKMYVCQFCVIPRPHFAESLMQQLPFSHMYILRVAFCILPLTTLFLLCLLLCHLLLIPSANCVSPLQIDSLSLFASLPNA